MRKQEPPTEALEEIRAHLTRVHGLDVFDADRDVAFPNRTPAGARVAFLPATRFARARFICSECNGGIFILGQSGPERPERTAAILRPDPKHGVTVLDEVRTANMLALLVREWSGHRLGEAV
jgi:hypothetical protein